MSVIILTFNEDANIEHTLRSVAAWAKEIIVIDSFSTDGTLDICRRFTDKIYQHTFNNQAQQFNWALSNIPIDGEWILRLDADETAAENLPEKIREALFNLPASVNGFYLRRRVYFLGRWMKHGGFYPKWIMRLFRKGKGRYEEVTEEHVVLSEGRALRLATDFTDYNRKGLTFWVDKHNHWSMGEMLDTLSIMSQTGIPDGTVSPRLAGTQEQRTRWMKMNVYARAPILLRAFFYFIYRYIFRLGFLDGLEGLIFHFLQGCWYRFLIDAKIFEARQLGTEFARTKRQYTNSKPWESPVERASN